MSRSGLVAVAVVAAAFVAGCTDREKRTAQYINEACLEHGGVVNTKLEDDGRGGGLAICRDGYARWVSP